MENAIGQGRTCDGRNDNFKSNRAGKETSMAEDHLSQAERHVFEGERRVAEQIARIAHIGTRSLSAQQ
jgi:hypothetical protein